jgi:hypothetical protein
MEIVSKEPKTEVSELMALLTVKPTGADVRIARSVARRTNHRTELIARGLTGGADEKILLAWWRPMARRSFAPRR